VSRIRTERRALPCAPDPCALLARITSEDAEVVLLESGDGPELGAARSFIVDRQALQIEIQGRRATITARSETGHCLLRRIEASRPAHLVEVAAGSLRLEWPPVDADADDDARIRAASPLDALRLTLGAADEVAPADRMLVGVFDSELIDSFETLDGSAGRSVVARLVLAERIIRIDHRAQTTEVVQLGLDGVSDLGGELDRLSQLMTALAPTPPAPLAPASSAATTVEGQAVRCDIGDERFADQVRSLQTEIRRGEAFQVVASRTFSIACGDPLAAYRNLRALNPSPYQFYLRRQDEVLFGASPETCVKVVPRAGALHLRLRPIAGTRPRGRDASGALCPDLDDRRSLDLMLDAKEQAEHLMLVDLARNDVARVCEPGTRRVSRLMSLERFSHVTHLVSEVSGVLRAGLDALHAYQACMNMGTLSGAPKLRATELYRSVEMGPRGPYGGAIGYLTGDGAMDSAIVIRSARVRDGTAEVRAGAGIVLDSDPAAEAEETQRKAAAVLAAIGAATVEAAA
jgi:anthranilate synthase component I